MSTAATAIGTLFCTGGAFAHFAKRNPHHEQLLAFSGLCFLVTAALLG